MLEFLYWVEEAPLSVAIAGSRYMYPAILAGHGMGMAVVVGLSWAVSLRVLGVASELPLVGMTKFFPVMWVGLGVNAVTGILLTMSAASRVLVDPVFFVKMTFVALAAVNLWLLKRELLPDDATIPTVNRALGATILHSAGKVKIMAVASIVLWGVAITLGRLMGYTFFRFWQ
jgi:hypothetical protein